MMTLLGTDYDFSGEVDNMKELVKEIKIANNLHVAKELYSLGEMTKEEYIKLMMNIIK